MNKIVKALIIILLVVGVLGILLYFMLNKDNSVQNIEYNYYKYYSNEKFGVIDNKGNILIEANYNDVLIPNPTYGVFFLVVDEENINVVNENGENQFNEFDKVLPIPLMGLIGEIPYEKNVLIYEKDGKNGLMDFNGKVITKPEFNMIESMPYKEGEIICRTDDKLLVLNDNGKEKIKLESDIEIMADGYYGKDKIEKSGYIISKSTENGIMYGYLNYKGKKILDLEYDRIMRIPNEENYLIVEKNGKYGLYKEKDVVINCNYQEMNYQEDINLYFVRRGNRNGVLDEKGNIVVPVEYKSVLNKTSFIEAVNDEDKIEKFTLKGEKTEKFDQYKTVEKCNFDDTYIAVTNEYKYKILDKNYNEIEIEEYEYIANVMPERYIVRDSDGKYGVINEQNIKLLENNYDVIQVISGSEVIQTMNIENDIISLFDKNGNKIFEEEQAFVILDKGHIKVFCNEGVKYYTLDGKEVSNQEIYVNNNIFGFYEDGKWGFKDKAGNVVVEAKYDRIVEIGETGYGGIKLGDEWGIIDGNGNIIVEPKFYIEDSISEPEFLNKFYKNYYASVGAFFVE